jgi:hypothetical protein
MSHRLSHALRVLDDLRGYPGQRATQRVHTCSKYSRSGAYKWGACQLLLLLLLCPRYRH